MSVFPTTQDGGVYVLRDGIYTLPNMNGLPYKLRGRIMPDGDARPIVTAYDGTSPYIEVQDNAHITGVWFGGDIPASDQPFIIKNNITLKACTLFHYYGGIGEGSGARNTIDGCRFVDCANGELGHYHTIYISNGAAGHWIEVKNNIFLGGSDGYQVHCFHGPNNATIARNFFGQNHWFMALEGTNHVAEDNILWSCDGGIGTSFFQDNPLTVTHNLVGSDIDYTIWDHPGPGRVCDDNTFYQGCPYLFGTNTHVVDHIAGIDAATIDATITAIRAVFDGGTTSIQTDATLEPLFAILQAALTTWNTPPAPPTRLGGAGSASAMQVPAGWDTQYMALERGRR